MSVSSSPGPWGAAKANPKTPASAGAAWSPPTMPTTGDTRLRRRPARQLLLMPIGPPAAPLGPWLPSPSSLEASTPPTRSPRRSVPGRWLVGAGWGLAGRGILQGGLLGGSSWVWFQLLLVMMWSPGFEGFEGLFQLEGEQICVLPVGGRTVGEEGPRRGLPSTMLQQCRWLCPS